VELRKEFGKATMPILTGLLAAALLGGAVYLIDQSMMPVGWGHCYFIPTGEGGNGDCIATRTLAIATAGFMGWSGGLLFGHR
jgi:hypothetical protein